MDDKRKRALERKKRYERLLEPWSLVSLRASKVKGRFLQACHPIGTGDTVLQDYAVSFSLVRGQIGVCCNFWYYFHRLNLWI